ncbi:MAG: polymerase beta domain protein region protein [Candidatus Moranbacteria bacterium GW2011_GWE1_35_17]|nr:MAG: polymerase beta domain protein region protein [Candidatus Moranbacteria bacterium GW2011_GWE1_35_17]KKP71751.1 MAG: polymerase beta domain protein region protein [Candidatus Moranbacteria bacterium GW2011_GWE2_35_164]KKP84665.1 MAG: polymerase beta domain protein region protein [Candidatus Moranbacteria bacterium GW2011_GWF2_35_54]
MMVRKHTNKDIQKIADKIARELKPEKIILFGSYAWGKPTKDSDIDLFIIKKSNKRKIDRARDVQRILFNEDIPAVDILVYTPLETKKRLALEDFFIEDIIHKGNIIYER